ncbi:MAG: YggT family protein [Clostridia bacterium]|nr:YggT family protein [Clostridia bacterium]
MTIAEILVTALNIFYEILTFAILLRCIVSWLPINRNNFFIKIIYSLTEPIMGPIRNLIEKSPLGGGMIIDFSPVIAYFVIYFIYSILVRIILAFL